MIKHARFTVGKWPYHLVDNEFHNDNDNDNNNDNDNDNEFPNDRLFRSERAELPFQCCDFSGQ